VHFENEPVTIVEVNVQTSLIAVHIDLRYGGSVDFRKQIETVFSRTTKIRGKGQTGERAVQCGAKVVCLRLRFKADDKFVFVLCKAG